MMDSQKCAALFNEQGMQSQLDTLKDGAEGRGAGWVHPPTMVDGGRHGQSAFFQAHEEQALASYCGSANDFSRYKKWQKSSSKNKQSGLTRGPAHEKREAHTRRCESEATEEKFRS